MLPPKKNDSHGGDFGVFPAPGQADFEHQRHLRRWAKNFQKVWYEKNFLKNF